MTRNEHGKMAWNFRKSTVSILSLNMSFLLSLLISSRLSHAVMLWKKYICYFALVSSFCSNFVSLDFVVDAIRCRGWFPFTLLLALFSIIRQHLNFHYIDYRCIYLHSSSSVYVMACRCFAPAHAMQIAHSLSLSPPSLSFYLLIFYYSLFIFSCV